MLGYLVPSGELALGGAWQQAHQFTIFVFVQFGISVCLLYIESCACDVWLSFSKQSGPQMIKHDVFSEYDMKE